MKLKPISMFLLVLNVFVMGNTAAEESPVALQKTRITLGSCNRQDRSQKFWNSITAEKSDLFLYLGDTIYSDTDDMQLKIQMYEGLFANPDFSRFYASTRVEAIWDDHDFSKNDFSGENYPFRAAAQQVFLNAFRVPANSPRRRHEGIYDSWMQGLPGRKIQIILLDTRYFKSPVATVRPTFEEISKGITGSHPPRENENLTMLGEQQWAWLEQQLLKPAKIRIIASGTQVVPYDRRGECWNNFPHERRRLFQLIQDTRASGVLFVSGDAHFSEISKTDEGPYPFYDFTSSSLNQTHQKRFESLNSLRVKDMMFAPSNYGVIEVDWDKPVPEVSMVTKSVKGVTAFTLTVPLSKLQFPAKRKTSEN